MLPKNILISIAIATLLAGPQFSRVALSQATNDQTQSSATETQQVESYLKSLLLDELVTAHLEIETSREVDLSSRRRMAARLVNQYAERMMSSRDGIESDWQSKTELLLQTYPELETPSIRIAILQAKYLSGEKTFLQWWNSGRDEQARRQLIGQWTDVKSELELLYRKLSADYEDQIATLQTIPENKEEQTRRLAHLDGLLLHTQYLTGWSSYFLGVLSLDQQRPFMKVASRSFRSFLQIEPEKSLLDVAPEWFDFSSDWNARSLIGLAMSERGLNHQQQSDFCFDLIGNHATNKQTRELRFVWNLNSRIYLNEVSAAIELVESFGEAREISREGRIAFWLASLKASRVTIAKPLNSSRLMMSGLQGLAREFEPSLIQDFLDEHDIHLSGDDFLSLWISGYMDLHRAESSQKRSGFEIALAQLSQAIERADESTSRFDVARCRYLIARIHFHEKKYEAAAAAAIDCSNIVMDLDSKLAAESQWLAVKALSEHSRTNRRALIRANQEIDQITKRFPGSTFARRAEFEKLRINIANLPPEKAASRLKQIPIDDFNYPIALNEIALIEYKLWLKSNKQASTEEPARLGALVDTETKFRNLSDASVESKLKTLLLVVDALLRTKPLTQAAVRERLDLAKSMAERGEIRGSVYNEYRYYEFLLASKSGQTERAIAEAEWMSKHAKGSKFERSTLIQLGQLADDRLKNLPNPSVDEINDVIAVFNRLVEQLGSSDEALAASSNARVAFTRLAELKGQLGAVEDSIKMLMTLNRVVPNHKTYLLQLARAQTNASQFEEAISIWRKLVAGAEPGQDLWFESKYYLTFCLHRSGDSEDARKLLAQTIRLSPNLPEKWQLSFDKLTVQLEAE